MIPFWGLQWITVRIWLDERIMENEREKVLCTPRLIRTDTGKYVAGICGSTITGSR